eukprot:6137103-Pyramimonas_sp.AAC.1
MTTGDPKAHSIGPCVSSCCLLARRGLPAGDMFNDAFVQVYALEFFDAFTIRHLLIRLSSHIDDD